MQLLTSFSKGRLVTSGAYSVVRNPIDASVTFFLALGSKYENDFARVDRLVPFKKPVRIVPPHVPLTSR